jgi:hypothetical protein
MEHLFFLDRFIQNVRKTLRPGGIFIGSVPNAFRWRNRWKFLFGREYEKDPTHVRQFSYQKLQRELQSFSEVEIIPIEGKILPFLAVGSRTPKRIGSLFAKDLLWRGIKRL